MIGSTVLVGADEIPASLPGLIEETLANGGISWPDIPGLAAFYPGDAITNLNPGSQVYPQPSGQVSGSSSSGDSTIWERFVLNFKKDTIANSLAVIVLIGMIISIIIVVAILVRTALAETLSPRIFTIRQSLFLLLVIVGLGVAGYLTYVELGKKPALCGPVGNCNTVQQSSYAKLFGVLPIGVIGLFGYASLLVAWGVYKLGPKTLHMLSTLALWGLAFFGVAFSIYLTFLEPFVIGATCMWCLSSALIMTALLWITTPILQESLSVDELGDENEAELAG